MRERFEEIFAQAQSELDSEDFDKVIDLIVAEFGEEVLDSDEYFALEQGMYWNL